ncbi:trihelix transcription factor GT-3b-like isoform X2 [Typha latifolia]|uniref:trihelix transcription factor GT-3b-like isoform X2 n=1 Tax=Typha latifolia TaxID=4733 RepID=UPI003C2E4381
MRGFLSGARRRRGISLPLEVNWRGISPCRSATRRSGSWSPLDWRRGVIAAPLISGKETSDPENGRQCPFFEELHTIFIERERNMQRELLKSESGGSNVTKKLKRFSGDRSSEEPSDDDEEDEDSDDDHHTRSRKRKADRVQQQQRATDKSASAATGIHSLLQDFLHQQQQMEIQWQEMMERRTQERLMFEQNWRQSMEKLERERLMMEQAWWEREEQRRIREEVRAEKRDTLLTTLLNKLIQDDQ